MFSLLQPITYHHNIRQRRYSLPLVKHVFAGKCRPMRFCIPDILNKTSNMITDKIKTHGRKGFTAYIKVFLINEYDLICSTPNFYRGLYVPVIIDSYYITNHEELIPCCSGVVPPSIAKLVRHQIGLRSASYVHSDWERSQWHA